MIALNFNILIFILLCLCNPSFAQYRDNSGPPYEPQVTIPDKSVSAYLNNVKNVSNVQKIQHSVVNVCSEEKLKNLIESETNKKTQEKCNQLKALNDQFNAGNSYYSDLEKLRSEQKTECAKKTAEQAISECNENYNRKIHNLRLDQDINQTNNGAAYSVFGDSNSKEYQDYFACQTGGTRVKDEIRLQVTTKVLADCKAEFAKKYTAEAQNKPASDDVGKSLDTCSNSIMLKLVKDAKGRMSGSQKQTDINGATSVSAEAVANAVKNMDRSEIQKKYGCTADENKISNMQAMMPLLQMAGMTASQISADKGVYQTANAAQNGGNVFRAGLENHGKTMKTAGRIQQMSSMTKVLMAAEATKIASRQGKAAKEIRSMHDENLADDYQKQCESDGQSYTNGICQKIKMTDLVGTLQDTDSVSTSEEAEKHQEIADKAKFLAIQNALMGVTEFASGTAMVSQGKAMIDQSKAAFGMPAPPPQMQLPQGEGIPLNLQTGQVGFGMGGGPSEAAVTDGGLNQSTPDDNTIADIPPPLLGPPNSGGLKDAPPPPGGGLVANTGSSGGGGGGGLGGGGGGSSGSGSENTNPSGQNLAGGVSKFDSTSNGGGFASTGGGNSNRVNSTGSMNFNEMLAKFLPKQGGEEEKDPKAKGILFDGPQGARGLASEPMDPSILGPNSNLFKRVSSAMLSKLKQGSLR